MTEAEVAHLWPFGPTKKQRQVLQEQGWEFVEGRIVHGQGYFRARDFMSYWSTMTVEPTAFEVSPASFGCPAEIAIPPKMN